MAYIHAFPYLSAKVWDDFVSAYDYTNCIDISELIFFLQYWEGPKLNPSYRN